MITIINIGGDINGVCCYVVQINRTVITTFEHDRKDRLAACLRRAADAVEMSNPDMFLEYYTAYHQEGKPEKS